MYQDRVEGDGDLVLVAIGSNEASEAGSPRATVSKAIEKLAHFFSDVTSSYLYETPAFPPGSGPNFVNAACTFPSKMPPVAVLDFLHQLEAESNRIRNQRWAQRTLDLDLLGVGDSILPDASTQHQWRDLPPDQQSQLAPSALILPHPRLQDRAFVLVPLADVAPDWVHPALNLTVTQMRDALAPELLDEVVRLS